MKSKAPTSARRQKTGPKRVPADPFMVVTSSPRLEHKDPPIQKRSARKTNAATITMYDEIPIRFESQNLTPRSINNKNNSTDLLLDNFLSKATRFPIYKAIEMAFRENYEADEVIYWQEVPNLQLLFSPTRNITVPHSNGLVGFAYFSRSIINIPSASAHPSYKADIDNQFLSYQSHVLLVPLFDWKNSVIGILQIIRDSDSMGYTQNNLDDLDWFARKFKLLSRFVLNLPPANPFIVDFMQLMRTEQFLSLLNRKITEQFHCRYAEIWKLDRETDEITLYSTKKTILPISKAGIAGDSLTRQQIINCVVNRFHCSYNPNIDGQNEEPVLIVPLSMTDTNTCYALALRGSTTNIVFSKDDEENVKTMIPYIIISLLNAEQFTRVDNKYQHSKMEREGLQTLIQIAEDLSGQLDKNKLSDLIINKGRTLTNADRCSLFLLNSNKDRLVTTLHHGLNKSIDIPINTGVVGRSVSENKIYNIPDAYAINFFDPKVDKQSGFKTKQILTVPIVNTRGEVLGATQMINRLDNKPFTSLDEKILRMFNVFCGISLENASLYKESLDMSAQLRSFFDISFSMTKTENIHNLLSDIIKNARNNINAENASLFIVDETNEVLTSYIIDGGNVPPTIPLKFGIAATCATNKQPIVVNDCYHDPRFNRNVDLSSGFKTRSVLVVPLITSKNECIGVTEMVNKQKGDFTDKDLMMMQSLATFASVALENSKLKDLALYGDVEVEISKWVGESERKSFEIPSKLALTLTQKRTIQSLNCFAVDFQGIGHVKELFYIFNYFDILNTFSITNDKLFHFIYDIRQTYNQVPYHNFTHACDVSQYVTYELLTAKLDNVLTKFEIFAMLISAVCHDANHNGFNNLYNIKSETPLGILFKDSSVMETHHITVTIRVIEKDENNLFYSLSPAETSKMWNFIIKMILATDMAKHFQLVKAANEICDNDEFSMENEDHRLLAMQLLVKVADISNVSRPFNIADKWCDILNEEFFRQGDREIESGLGLSSPLNDRKNINKPKSQIGFYNFICFPLYQSLARMFTALQVNVDSLKSNLSVWMSMVKE